MREKLNGYISNLLRLKYRLELPSYTGTYFVLPVPNYISQFVRIYPATIGTDTPLTNNRDRQVYGAKDVKEFSFWAWRNCGIACVKMILEIEGKAGDKTIMDLTREGIELGGYKVYERGEFVDKGWFHKGLVLLLGKYGIKAKMKRWQTMESVAKDILENKRVILSVNVPGRKYIKEDGSFEGKEDTKRGGHLLLATGIRMDGKMVEGIYVHDPRGLERYQENTYIPAATLSRIFMNRTIVSDFHLN